MVRFTKWVNPSPPLLMANVESGETLSFVFFVFVVTKLHSGITNRVFNLRYPTVSVLMCKVHQECIVREDPVTVDLAFNTKVHTFNMLVRLTTI